MKKLQKYASIFTITLSFASSMLASEVGESNQDVAAPETSTNVPQQPDYNQRVIDEMVSVAKKEKKFHKKEMLKYAKSLCPKQPQINARIATKLEKHTKAFHNYKGIAENPLGHIQFLRNINNSLVHMAAYAAMGVNGVANEISSAYFVEKGLQAALQTKKKESYSPLNDFLTSELVRCNEENPDKFCAPLKKALRNALEIVAREQKNNQG